ncbi:MAG: hypothetical protein ACRDP3_19115 [Streptomyces sp.]|uniref:hypothetical protein n=1 Tax=Streptomyces sp. TaxID=1931 RepID=UPI003D6B46BA
MAADRLAQAVRQQLGLGRLLPLGDAADGAWLAETAAVATLRDAAAGALPEVRLGTLRISLADPDGAAPPAVPAPPSALRPGPLHLDADFATSADAPLPTVGDRLRGVLLTAADKELGLRVAAADLRVTDLLDGLDGPGSPGSGAGGPGARRHRTDERPPAPADSPRGIATAEAVLAVPGVARLAPALGWARGGAAGDGAEAVSVTETRQGAEEGRHVQIQIAVTQGSRALDVARAVRHAATKAAAWDAVEPAGPVTVAVLVSAIDPPPETSY